LRHIRGFDGLRAISIVLVIVTHAGAFHALPDDHFIRARLWKLVSGNTGVDIFFTLSGFLITRLLLLERARTGRLDLRRFYIRRFLRLTPPMVLFILVSGGLMLAGLTATWAPGLLVSFFYLYNFIPTTHFNGTLGHTWSLAVEEQFYLLWPFVLRLSATRGAYLAAAVLVGLSVIAVHLLPGLVVPGSAHGMLVGDLFHVRRLFIPAVAPIMVGALAALLLAQGGDAVRRRMRTAWWPRAIVLLYSAPLYVPEAALPSAFILQAAGVAMLLLWLLERQDGRLAMALEWRPAAYVGRISYGLYLYHVVFMGTGPGEGLIGSFPLNVLASFLFALLSYELMERRVLRYKERFR